MPRKATKVCAKGHRQSTRWKPDDGCTKCGLERLEAERAANGVEERRRWQEELGHPPASVTIQTGDGEVLSFSAGPGRRSGLARRPRRR